MNYSISVNDDILSFLKESVDDFLTTKNVDKMINLILSCNKLYVNSINRSYIDSNIVLNSNNFELDRNLTLAWHHTDDIVAINMTFVYAIFIYTNNLRFLIDLLKFLRNHSNFLMCFYRPKTSDCDLMIIEHCDLNKIITHIFTKLMNFNNWIPHLLFYSNVSINKLLIVLNKKKISLSKALIITINFVYNRRLLSNRIFSYREIIYYFAVLKLKFNNDRIRLKYSLGLFD